MGTLDNKHLPFVRTDRYGEGGWAPQHFIEKIRLALLACTLLPCRLLSCMSVVASYYLLVRIVDLLPIRELWQRRIRTFFGKIHSRLCLFTLGFVSIRWIRVGTAKGASSKRRSVAVVSNHMSWADILIQMARYFPAFVARNGTQNLPMIGLISQRMQCIYVEREKKNDNSRPVTPDVTPNVTSAAAAVTEETEASSRSNKPSHLHHTATAADGSSSCSQPDTPDPGVVLEPAGRGVPASVSAAAAAAAQGNKMAPIGGGVAAAVKQRMLLTVERPELELRPMLLFPEGTTSNGRYLLPFKTGAFLAGVSVLPTIIQYSSSSGSSSKTARVIALIVVLAAAAAAAVLALARGASAAAAAAAAAGAAVVVCGLSLGSLDGQGGVSPCWESIDATRHLLLMACQPFHLVRCYELPLYTPNVAEKQNPKLYAANVRQYMLKYSSEVAAAAAARAAAKGRPGSSAVTALQASDGLLADKRDYQAGVKARRQDVEAGRGLTADWFVQRQCQVQDGAGKKQQ